MGSLAGLRAVVTGGAGSALRSSPLFTLLEVDITDGITVDGPVDWVRHLASPA